MMLVAGGANRTAAFLLRTAELYDPALGTWSATGSLHIARAFHTATLLPDGRVLVAGGLNINSHPSASAELYDTGERDVDCYGQPQHRTRFHTATLLPNGWYWWLGDRVVVPMLSESGTV